MAEQNLLTNDTPFISGESVENVLTIYPSQNIIEKILARQLTFDTYQAIGKQNNPFKKGEKLVVVGSSIPLLDGYEDPERVPYLRMASDMDLSIVSADGNQLQNRWLVMLKVEHALSLAIHMIGASFTKAERNIGKGIVRKEYSTDAIKSVLSSPASQVLLKRIYGEKGLISLDRIVPTTAKIEVDLIPEALGLIPPKPFVSQPGTADKLPIWRDDTDNSIALKLARLMHIPDKKDSYHKVTDIIDIYDILRMREVRDIPPPDQRVLRVLIATKMTDMKAEYNARKHEYSFVRLTPTEENIDIVARELHKQAGVSISKAKVKEILTVVDNLVASLYPQRSTDGLLGLTLAEDEFIAQKKPFKERLEGLKKEYPDVFFRHPGLDRAINRNCAPQRDYF